MAVRPEYPNMDDFSAFSYFFFFPAGGFAKVSYETTLVDSASVASLKPVSVRVDSIREMEGSSSWKEPRLSQLGERLI